MTSLVSTLSLRFLLILLTIVALLILTVLLFAHLHPLAIPTFAQSTAAVVD